MCGISGIFGPGAVDVGALRRMASSLAHRGPDGEGYWQDKEGGIGFTHRRLSIVDLSSSGEQPMQDASGRWVITFNGEIYNHREIRKELGSAVASWRGSSDTEVLLEAVARWGVVEALRRFEGMFAFALWDRRDRELVVARDRMGERPVYIGWIGDDIAFGSELSSLRMHPQWRGGTVEAAVSLFLRFGFVPAPMSIHPGVFKLPAGSLLRLRETDAGRLWSQSEFMGRVEPYWRLASVVESSRREPFGGTFEEAVDEARVLLDRAVACRAQADVPVGALLSGGVDSSIVVESMQRQSSTPVDTFTVGFDEAGIDESEVAAGVARALGTNHSVVRLPVGSAQALVRCVADVYDEPFADVAQLPAILLSGVVRKKVSVALTGDGGDELFAGYQRYHDCARAWGWRSRMPSVAVDAISGVLAGISGFNPASWGRLPARASRTIVRWQPSQLGQFYEDWLAFPGAPAARAQELLWRSSNVERPAIPISAAAQMRYLDQCVTLPEGIHTKLDRASMSQGLELRVPLLDSSLVAFSWRLPEQWLRNGKNGKVVLRSMLARSLPRAIAKRPKQGFDVPISEWLRSGLRDWASELLESAEDSPGFDVGYFRRSFDQHLQGRVEHGHSLWAALVFLAWRRKHG